MLDDSTVLIPEIFASHATYFPEREAVVCGAERLSWGEFDAGIARIACALEREGIGRGQQVAVLMGNAALTLQAIFGVVRAGACVVPLSGLLTGEQLAGLLEDSGAALVLAAPEFRAKLTPELRARCTQVRDNGWVAVLGDEAAAASGSDDTPWRSFSDLVAGIGPDQRPRAVLRASDPFNIIYSSGTTGLPKGIVQTHRARTHWAFSNAIELGMGGQSRALTTTALYSNGTWLMMLPVLFAGGTCVVLPAFTPAAFLAMAQAERITHSFMVPAQYLALLNEGREGAPGSLESFDLSALQSLLSAGSPLRRDTKREVLRRFGNKLTELYGYSEGFATMLKPHEHEAHFESVGTPVLGFELRILGDAGEVLPRGEVGEIAGYGAGMMAGYHRRPEATEALIWRDERGRSFIRSGDVGRLDAEGYLHIVDRKKDMIISGGFNVFPTDIEAVVGAHPDVLDVTVIGIPHEKWGETPLALVIAKAEVTTQGAALAEAIREWANARLAAPQRLAAVELRAEFPRNALGKVLKRLLREPYWAGAGRVI